MTAHDVPAAPRVRVGLRTAFALGAMAILSLCALMNTCDPAEFVSDVFGTLELDTRSDYSHIRVTRTRNVRTLYFVRDSGEEVIESELNLERPYELIVPYTRYMFLSYAFRPVQERVLIVGLGGGSMVHFLRHYDPKVQVDVVEIDPVMVQIARDYFGVKNEGNVKIITGDGIDYLRKTETRYDVIYMDAFLKPSRETDTTGAPLRLKTAQFYKEIQSKLKPEGLVVINLNSHANIRGDVETVRETFPQTYVFQAPDVFNLVVVGSLAPARLTFTAISRRASEEDRRFQTSYKFREMANHLSRQGRAR